MTWEAFRAERQLPPTTCYPNHERVRAIELSSTRLVGPLYGACTRKKRFLLNKGMPHCDDVQASESRRHHLAYTCE